MGLWDLINETTFYSHAIKVKAKTTIWPFEGSSANPEQFKRGVECDIDIADNMHLPVGLLLWIGR